MASNPRRIGKRRKNAERLSDAPTDGVGPPRGGPPAGRARNYNDDEDPRFVRQMCRLGATNAVLADWFGVTIQTIQNWASYFPRFAEAIKVGKGEFDDEIERALASRAMGYTYDAVKIFLPAGTTMPVVVPYREHVPPDVRACEIWLQNRRPDVWRRGPQEKLGITLSFTFTEDQMEY